MTPPDDRLAQHRYLYLTNTQHSEETGIHSLRGFEPTIFLASERPQTHTLDHLVTGTGKLRVSIGEIDYLKCPKN